MEESQETNTEQAAATTSQGSFQHSASSESDERTDLSLITDPLLFQYLKVTSLLSTPTVTLPRSHLR